MKVATLGGRALEVARALKGGRGAGANLDGMESGDGGKLGRLGGRAVGRVVVSRGQGRELTSEDDGEMWQ